MPMIEATLLEGYDDSVKSRFAKALIRAAQSVMAAHVDGIVIVLREVPIGNYWRGGAARTAGPALPAAPDVVRSFIGVLETGGDFQSTIAEEFQAKLPGGNIVNMPLEIKAVMTAHYPTFRKIYEQWDEALVDGGSIVFGFGKLVDETSADSGLRFIDRFAVANGRITELTSWIDQP